MELLYLQNKDTRILKANDYVKFAGGSIKAVVYAPLGDTVIIGHCVETIYPGRWGHIYPLNYPGLPDEFLRLDQSVSPQTTQGLFTFPSVGIIADISPTAEGGVWVGYIEEVYDEDTETYIMGLAETLTSSQLDLINAFIVGLKTDLGIDNLTDIFDVIYYTGNETAESSLRNMVKREHDGVAVNSPTFTPYEGWTGDGVSSYIDFNYNPNTDAVNIAQNNLCAGYYSRTNTVNSECIFGARGTLARIYVLLNVAGATGYYYVNTTNTGGVILVSNDGMICLIREDPATHRLYRNKVQADSEADASGGLPNCNLWGLAANNGADAVFSPGTSQLSFVFVGRLDATGIANITDRFETLMDANGKGVIT